LDVNRDRVQLRSFFVLGAIFALLIAVPFFGSRAQVVLATEFCAVLAIAIAWNLLAGFAGMILIGQALFIGIGGYALYVAGNALGIVPYPLIVMGGLVAAIAAFVLSPVLFRLTGAQFAIGSWVLAEIAQILVLQSDALGAGGGINLETIKLVPRTARLTYNYAATATILVISILAVLALLKSRYGLALRALRDSEAAAEAAGVNTQNIRLLVLVLSAAISGAAGAAFYISSLQITPGSAFSINWTAVVVFIVILGGIGTVEGPFVGAVVYFILREVLSGAGSTYFIVTGTLAIVITLFMPTGLWGLIRRSLACDLLPVTHFPAGRVQSAAQMRSQDDVAIPQKALPPQSQSL
jgi:branched-chain amino acid transport system permease protein